MSVLGDAKATHDDLTALVTRARNGDKQAWDELVERYAPLIWSICRRYRLRRADADDVGQNVWLQLAGQLAFLRDPAALPGWLATTTQRECGRVLRAARIQAPGHWLDAADIPDTAMGVVESELLRAERHAALREAFTHLPPSSQQLIALLIQDPPVPYAEISAKLGIPIGSIGPNRGRCLQQLRRHPAIAALINADARSTGGDILCPASGGKMTIRSSRRPATPSARHAPRRPSGNRSKGLRRPGRDIDH
jgi:RNA polymerase sigma factor (sigma-70 family)